MLPPPFPPRQVLSFEDRHYPTSQSTGTSKNEDLVQRAPKLSQIESVSKLPEADVK